jgi:hypothetical protein
VRANSFEAIKRAEARERMAALHRARKSRRAALAEQRAAGILDGSLGRITNLRQVFKALSEYAN